MMSCNLMHAFRHVSMIASTNLQRVSSKPTPRVSVFIFGMGAIIVHPRSVGISLFCHMYCVRYTIFLHFSGFEGLEIPSARYAPLINFLKCSYLICLWSPALFRRKRWTESSTSASIGTLLLILNAVMWVVTGLSGGGEVRSSHQ